MPRISYVHNPPLLPAATRARARLDRRRRTIERCAPTAPGRLPPVLSATGRLHALLSQRTPRQHRHAAHVQHRRVLPRTGVRAAANVVCVMLCGLTAGYVLEPLDGLSRCKLLSGVDDLEVGHLLALVTVMPSAFWSADLAPAQQLAQVADDNRLEAVPFLDCLQMSLVIVFDEPKHAVGSAQALHRRARGRTPSRGTDPFAWHNRC